MFILQHFNKHAYNIIQLRSCGQVHDVIQLLWSMTFIRKSKVDEHNIIMIITSVERAKEKKTKNNL